MLNTMPLPLTLLPTPTSPPTHTSLLTPTSLPTPTLLPNHFPMAAYDKDANNTCDDGPCPRPEPLHAAVEPTES
jgi:hypothetical protein